MTSRKITKQLITKQDLALGRGKVTQERGGIPYELNRINGDELSVLAKGSTVPRDLAERFSDVVNVKDFGAKGDGVTDDTAALVAARNHINANKGGVLYFPYTKDAYTFTNHKEGSDTSYYGK